MAESFKSDGADESEGGAAGTRGAWIELCH